MNLEIFEGGWYVDAKADGAIAVLIPGQHVRWRRAFFEPFEVVALPDQQNVLFVCMPRDGSRVAGVGNDGAVKDRALVYEGQRVWHDHGVAFGPEAVEWDAAGHLLVVREPPAHGWRQVDDAGRPVTCDETRADTVAGLWEWVRRGSWRVGHAGEGPLGDDPLIAIHDELGAFLLSEGRCRFNKFDVAGGRFAIACVREDLNRAEVRFGRVDELLQLPRFTRDAPSPPPRPMPPHPSVPSEEEPTVSIPDQRALVEAIRNELYPDKVGQPLHDHEKAFQITKRVAWALRDHGIGLVAAKPGSENNVEGYTADIVALADGQHWDILIGVEAEAFPTWSKVDNAHNGPIVARWRPPIAPSEPAPPGNPSKPPPDATLLARVVALERRVKELEEAEGPTPEQIIAVILPAVAMRLGQMLNEELPRELAHYARYGDPVRVPLSWKSPLIGTIQKPEER